MMAPTIPPGIAPRVGALLRMLASSADGEVINAARAIGRTLRGVGLDVNDLAEIIECGPVTVFRDRPEPPPQSRRGRKVQPGDIELSFSRRVAVLAALQRALDGDHLSDWEHEFATSILVRLQAGRGRLTERQGEALERVLAKVGEVFP